MNTSGIIPEIVTPGDLGDEIGSFLRHMRRENVSKHTILTYGTACRLFAEYLVAQGRPTDMAAITKDDIIHWELALRARVSVPTVHNRHRGLQRFFTWYSDQQPDDEPWVNPMARLKPPKLPQAEPRVLTIDELRMIIGSCKGSTFEDRRDEALIRVLFNTGARRNEIVSLRYSMTDPADRDVNLAAKTIHIRHGKGDKARKVGIDNNTLDALETYILRARKRHPDASLPNLWLGARGPLTDSGLAQAVRRRGKLAGIPNLHPHDFRHAWRHHGDMAGLDRETMMSLGGWSSDAMLRRYARTTQNTRALEHARKVALGDKL